MCVPIFTEESQRSGYLSLTSPVPRLFFLNLDTGCSEEPLPSRYIRLVRQKESGCKEKPPSVVSSHTPLFLDFRNIKRQGHPRSDMLLIDNNHNNFSGEQITGHSYPAPSIVALILFRINEDFCMGGSTEVSKYRLRGAGLFYRRPVRYGPRYRSRFPKGGRFSPRTF